MNPTINIDARQWQQAARDLFATSSRSLVDFTNGQALSVASRALKLTKEANKQQIEHLLGQVGRVSKTITKGKRKGEKKLGQRVIHHDLENTFASRILTKHFNETGQWLAKGATLVDRVRNYISKRVASVSYVRSGWIPALKQLIAVVKRKPSGISSGTQGARQIGNPKGKAMPASNTFSKVIFSTIQNDVPGLIELTDRNVAEEGLRLALQDAARDMIEELAKRLKRDLAKFGAK